MLMRRFDASTQAGDDAATAALERHDSVLREPSRHPAFRIEHTQVLPFESELVWQLLLETQHQGQWLHEALYSSDRPLPEVFCRGSSIDGGHAMVLDCEVSKYTRHARLNLQRLFWTDSPPVYWTFEVTPHERFQTRLKVSALFAEQRLPGAAVFVRGVLNLDDEKRFARARPELEGAMRKAMKRFAHFCSDRIEFGPTAQHGPGTWFIWDYEPDCLKYYKNRNGHDGPEIGELIQQGERIGFVHPAGVAGPLDRWKDSHYLSPAPGHVACILKRHGDHIEAGDRILLTTPERDADLSEARLRMDELIQSAGGSRSESYVVASCDVAPGQGVRQGDRLATLTVRDASNKEALPLHTPYDGTVVAVGTAAGDRLWMKEGSVLFTLRCRRAAIEQPSALQAR